MKKTFTLMIAISIAFVGFAQNRVVVSHNFKALNNENVKSVQGTFTGNLDFENWSSDVQSYGLGLHPEGMAMLTGNFDGQQSTDAQSGTYAMHVESNVTSNTILQWNDTLVSGIAFAGDLIAGSFGEDYTSQPTEMTGYIKGSLLAQDTAFIIVQLRNADSVLASGVLAFGGADISTSYTAFSLSIIDGGSTLTPDSIDIIVSSSGHGLFSDGDIGTLTAGSYIDVDNFTLTTTGSEVETVSALTETNIYPNPANTVLNINTEEGSDIIIYNLLGKEVYSVKNSQRVNTINVSEFTEGSYIVKVINNNNTFTKKISIIK